MEHALHLAAKHFIEDVSPTSVRKLLNKVKEAMANATDPDEAVDLDALNTELSSIEAELLSGEASEDGEDGGFDVADTIRKALALITQV
jgi:hypothetical protein